MPKLSKPLKGKQEQNPTCCGTIEEATHKAHEKRANRTKPQPWIARKLMVAITLALIAYSAYVYVARLCVRMIRRERGVRGSRGAGIALLVVFSILFLWMLWAYIKVVLTPPGYARDHVPKSPRPLFPEPPRPTSSFHTQTSEQDADSIGGPSYENIPVRHGHKPLDPHPPLALPPPVTMGMGSGKKAGKSKIGKARGSEIGSKGKGLGMGKGKGTGTGKRRIENENGGLKVERRPPMVPVLMPEHRYCGIDEIVKPYRAHHCRGCGTCVLKYDHHCPWIGQCVGARNQKFFLNFTQAASIYTLYTLGTLVAYTVKAIKSPDGDLDPQWIVMIALSALFALFTISLTVSHVHLIMVGQTTVESLQMRTVRDREEWALRDGFGWWGVLAKRETRREWDKEWGRVGREGNIWWLGSARAGWEDVMGRSVLGWILPVGRSMSDGLTYPVNPRFDEQGRWRRRSEWPVHLR